MSEGFSCFAGSNPAITADPPAQFPFARNSRVWILLFALVLGFLVSCYCRTIRDPWVEEDNWYGAVYSQAAHNNLRAGLTVTGGVPVTLYYGPLPFPRDVFYVHHPTLLPLLVTASFGLLGESEWAAKLVPIACTLLSVIFLWLLVRDLAGRRAGTLVALIFATLPMQLHYGDMVDFEAPLLMLMLATLLSLQYWRTTGRVLWMMPATLFVFLALWMDWPGYLFVLSLVVCFWLRGTKGSRLFALALLGVIAVSGVFFLLQIRYVNPAAWHDLAIAVRMRLGNGVATGSSAMAREPNLHFTFWEWCRTVAHGLHENYGWLPWLLAAGGTVYAVHQHQVSAGLRQAGWGALQIAIIGAAYMTILRNWSYIHDWSSFYLSAPVAIMGGMGLDGALNWIERRKPARYLRVGTVLFLGGLALLLGGTGFRQSESMRSQFLMLDGITSEPRNLIPNLGLFLTKSFSPEITILSNFDPYSSTLPYYAQRTILNNLGSEAEWKAAISDETGPLGGIIWRDAPGAAALLAALPKEEVSAVELDGCLFAVWKRGHRR